MTSVKEQMSGTYASRLAHHGIIAMAIDYANWGESSGAERHAEVQTQKAKDLSSAVSYQVNRKDVAATALLGIWHMHFWWKYSLCCRRRSSCARFGNSSRLFWAAASSFNTVWC